MTDLDSLPDGTYTAVEDAVKDGFATVFFERDWDEVGDAMLDAGVLPEAARHADAVLDVTSEASELVDATYPSRAEGDPVGGRTGPLRSDVGAVLVRRRVLISSYPVVSCSFG